MKPSVNFVLHAHLPWVKGAGVWPFGQEWLYQAMLDTYLPLLDLLKRLRVGCVSGAITLGITPVLIEMLRDPELIAGFDAYLDARIELLEQDIVSFGEFETELRQLAMGTRATIQNVRKHWHSYDRDLIRAFRDFAQTGEIEIITSAATHAYLPLLDSPAQIEAQIANGIAATTEAFGKAPAGIWLPECAFDPSLIPVLQRHNLRYFYAGERAVDELSPDVDRAYRFPKSDVAFFVRHPLARGELMDTDLGYPGNTWYREFYKRHNASGVRYWRVTSRDASLGEKEPYEPARAFEQIRLHADDFAKKILALESSEQTYFTFTFDAELFGHWWSEGIYWLEETLVQLYLEETAGFELPTTYLNRQSEISELALPRSSWGVGGDDRIWSNPQTAEYWEKVHALGAEFEELAATVDPQTPLMRQAARELFLLQSSDWPFLITNRGAGRFPFERIETHAHRFDQCVRAVRSQPHDAAVIDEAMRDDSLLAHINTRAFTQAANLA